MTDEKMLSYLTRATAELERTRRRVAELEAGNDDRIAIVGLGCRYPGADGPAALWDLVASGRDSIGGFPANRGWNPEVVRQAPPHGGFLDTATDFDAEFFGISPREARAMDPQQRLILETAWETLEDAGLPVTDLAGTAVGVFTGAYLLGHPQLLHAAGHQVRGHVLTGSQTSVISGRVSYALDFDGPSVTVDTACSSSLVAIHLAVQALRAGDCDLALAGGVSVLATPDIFLELAAQGTLAPDGRCKAFADAADGTGWSEGVGLVLLERLPDALDRGHDVLAVVRGSAVNSDGASNGLSAPNGLSQQRVIRRALADSGLTAADVDAVEAHGTGTRLGDPIEAQAILATYGTDRPADRPVLIGSLKSNIGHTQAAAGVGGVIKIVQALRHQLLPATLHIDRPSSRIDWSRGNAQVLTAPTPWPVSERVRRAAVSSFGVSGTNAHLILEGPEVLGDLPPSDSAPPAVPASFTTWVFSARTERALAAYADRLRGLASSANLSDVSWSLAAHRAPLPYRAVVSGTDRAAIVGGVEAVARREPAAGVVQGKIHPEPRVAFVLPGQGGQWVGMATELAAQEPAFAAALRVAADALRPLVSWSLTDVLTDPEALTRPEVLQPVLWAVGVSLAELYRSYGVEPAAVIGHSQGEIAAACIAGALSWSQGALVITRRSAIASELVADRGALVAVAAGADETEKLLASVGGGLAISVINGPAAVVVGGERDALRELVARCTARGIETHEIANSFASHTAAMDVLREPLGSGSGLPTPSYAGAVLPIYSTVTGAAANAHTFGADYWFRNFRSTVQFEKAVRAALADRCTAFLELSAHPVLQSPLHEILEDSLAESPLVTHALRRDDGGTRRFRESLAALFVHGVPVTWTAAFATGSPRRAALPTYSFERRRFWPTPSRGTTGETPVYLPTDGHPFVDAVLPLAATGGMMVLGRFSLDRYPWLADHVIRGHPVLPAAVLLELTAYLGRRVGAEHISELTLHRPVILPRDTAAHFQITVGGADATGQRELAVFVDVGEGEWVEHASGSLRPTGTSSSAAPVTEMVAPRSEVDVSAFYDRLSGVGIEYGPAFRGLVSARITAGGAQVTAEVRLPGDVPMEGFLIPPPALDSALQTVLLTDAVTSRLAFTFSDVRVHRAAGSKVQVSTSADTHGVSVRLTDAEGVALLSIATIGLRPLPEVGLDAVPTDLAMLRVGWMPLPASTVPAGDPLPLLSDVRSAARTSQDARKAIALQVPSSQATDPGTIHQTVIWAAEQLRVFLNDDRLATGRLIVCTRGAVAVGENEPVDPAGAAVCGFLRSAQRENPGRIALVDLDPAEPLMPTLSVDFGHEQVAVRAGTVLVPRLERLQSAGSEQARTFEPGGTILITGGMGGLGTLVARHLAARYGVRHLLLTGRRGGSVPGSADIAADLTGLGCTATFAAVDVADRDALADLLASIPPDRPLTGVVHLAGVVDDGLAAGLSPAQIDRVLSPKVDGLCNLDELTRERSLSLFTVFSSVTGTIGGAGNANYAAANAYMDALIRRRRHDGLPGNALAWGPWGVDSGIAAKLSAADRRRLERIGMQPLTGEDGMHLLDQALTADRDNVVLTRLDLNALQSADERPEILAGLIQETRHHDHRSSDHRDETQRLLALPADDRGPALTALIARHAAIILAHPDDSAITGTHAFKDLGFDSLTALELRTRLKRATGLALPATILFDHTTIADLANHLARCLATTTQPPAPKEETTATPDAFKTPRSLTELITEIGLSSVAEQQVAVAYKMALAGADLRPMATDAAEFRGRIPVHELSPATGREPLICICPVVSLTSPDAYLRLALELTGRRQVIAVVPPGFGAGEALPANIGVLSTALADAVLAHLGDRPYALAGLSSGGAVAHELARETAARGRPATGVILLDTYRMNDPVVHAMENALATALVGRHRGDGFTFENLTAGAWYVKHLFYHWTPAEITVPSLLAQATEPMTPAEDENWRSDLEPISATVDLPGNHFTILEDNHVKVAATAIDEWLVKVVSGPPEKME